MRLIGVRRPGRVMVATAMVMLASAGLASARTTSVSSSTRAAAIATRLCGAGDVLATNDQVDAARKAYVDALRADPTSSGACAGRGFVRLDRKAAVAGKSSDLCVTAEALHHARQDDAAKAEYVSVLKKHPGAVCATNALRRRGFTDSLTTWLESVVDAGLAVLGWGALIVGVLAVAVLVLSRFSGPRWRLVQIGWMDQLLAPRLAFKELKDGGAPAGIGGGITALAREEVMASSKASTATYRLDRLDGKDGFDTAVAAVAELTPTFKALAAVLGLVEWLLPRARLTASGVLQVEGGRGEGAALQLEGGKAPVASTLWMGPAARATAMPKAATAGSDTPANGSAFQPLAVPIGAWIDFEVRATLAAPPPTGNACSFALLQGALAAERRGGDDDALRLYAAAIQADPNNVRAIVNRANLRARHRQEYLSAVADLQQAVMILYLGP